MIRPPHPTDKQAKPLISEAEMALLLTTQERKLLKGFDPGFKLRNLFLLVVVLFFVIRLVFFWEQTSLGLNAAPDVRDLRPYLQYRGIFIVLMAAIYIYSYVQDWHFERIALIMFGMTLTGLTMDFFNVYSLIEGPLPTHVLALVFLRIAAIFTLFVNAIRADRAPPLPRSFWR